MNLRIAALGTLCLIAQLALPHAALSQNADYPTRPIKVVVPYPPGGAVDIIGRTLSQKLEDQLKQSVIVENRPGAAQIAGTRSVAQAAPDGYTFLVITASHATNPAFVKDLPYDSIRDFTPISLVAVGQNVLVVNPSLPVKSVSDLINLAKEKNGQLQYASSGLGSASQLAMELFNSMAGIKMVHVPFKGAAEASMDIAGGRVALMFTSPLAVVEQAKSGTLRIIASSGKQRLSSLPDVPTVAEAAVPKYEALLWYALLGPRGLPQQITDKVSAAVKVAMQQKDVKDRFATGGVEPASSTPKELEDFIASETAKWTDVIVKAGIQQQ